MNVREQMLFISNFQEYPGGKDRGAENHTKTGFTKLVKVGVELKLFFDSSQFNFRFLKQKLREEFDKEAYENDQDRLLLSAAVAAARHRIDEGYDVEKICK
jgi:hypothetical protein